MLSMGFLKKKKKKKQLEDFFFLKFYLNYMVGFFFPVT